MIKSKEFINKFTVLRGAPKELWVVYFQKVLEVVAYGLMTSVLILFLQKDINLGDKSAGFYFATWSLLASLFTILVGPLTDFIGIKKTFVIGFLLCIFSRGIMSFVTNPILVSILGFLPLAAGHAMMIPVMTAAVRELSTPKQRSMAFSGFYWLMNVGFLISGPIVDYVRDPKVVGDNGKFPLPLFNIELSAYQLLFFLSFVFTIPGYIAVTFFMREGIRVDEFGNVLIKECKNVETKNNIFLRVYEAFKKATTTTYSTFKELVKYKSFWRFMLFISLLVGVKLTFYHMHVTFPPYLVRTLGEGAKFGTVWGFLNPLLILILVPIIGATTQKVSVYKMILIGTSFSGFSIFLLAIPFSLYEPLVPTFIGKIIWSVWLGFPPETSKIVLASYIGITVFVILFSIGEALWSPKLYEYVAEIAPEGKTASYMSLSILPFFVAKFIAGGMSGILLDLWCPSVGDKSSAYIIWIIIGCIAISCPMGLLLLKNIIRKKDVT
ncbi:MAG: MFS transporter [Leptospiraceae bacterium]|nr:MFS transporter [Leptospiraceae bacterium]MCP5494959.1 MFS transporter [Leptospiraceae bacterium]